MDGDQTKSNKVKLNTMIINIIKGRQILKAYKSEKTPAGEIYFCFL